MRSMQDSLIDDENDNGGRIRLLSFLVLAPISTFFYVSSSFMMLMVPGIEAASKAWMLGISGALFGITLLIGAWRPSTSSAPLLARSFCPYIGAFLAFELVLCLLQLFAAITKRPH
jgi:hypothetical protein